MALQGCFDCTTWEFFNSSNIDNQIETVSDYMNFCVDSVIPTKSFKVYPNDQPWVSIKLKNLIADKKKAHRNQDETARRDVQRQIKRQIQLDKHSYKQKIEATLASGNSREAWQGIKTMTNVPHKGRGKPALTLDGSEGLEMANQLNSFFCQFESSSSSEAATLMPPSLPPLSSNFTIKESEVFHLFRGCSPRKSPGPDNISGNVLKHCAEQLAPVFTDIFKSSFDLNKVPTLWKTSTIVPVPKNPRPTPPNDFQPIALTSLVMKCFERLVKRYIILQTQHLMDPLQFAYQASRGGGRCIFNVTALIAHLP